MSTDHPRPAIAHPVYYPLRTSSAPRTTARPKPFEIVVASDEDGTKVRVIASTINGGLPAGFSTGDHPPYILDVSDGDTIYACVSFDVSGGFPVSTSSRTLGCGATVPIDDTESATFYYAIGSVALVDGVLYPANYVFGGLVCVAERDWFNADGVTFSATWGSN